MSSTSVGSRPSRRKFASRYSISSGAKREAEFAVRALERGAAVRVERDRRERPRRHVDEQTRRVGEIGEYGFDHAVVDERQERGPILGRKRRAGAAAHPVCDAALDAGDRGQAAVARDVGRLRRPRRDRARSWHDEQKRAVDARVGCRFGTVGQQRLERAAFVRRQRTRELDEVPVSGIEGVDAMGGPDLRQALQQLGEPERRERRPARQREDFSHRRRRRKAELYASRLRAQASRAPRFTPPREGRADRRRCVADRGGRATRPCRCASRRRPSSRHRHRRNAGTPGRRDIARGCLP